MPKVTVIMPSLNVAEYISQCMESVLNQTLSDLEILAIDAGSTDGTLEILNKYKQKDKRVKVIISDKKSYGYQINLGIRLATGEYVGIVETDDVIDKDMYFILYQAAVEKNAEYVKGTGVFTLDLGNGHTWNNPIWAPLGDTGKMGQMIAPSNLPNLFIYDTFLWLGLYQRKFLQGIKLNETQGAAYQDVGFMFQVLTTAKRAVYLENAIYYYRQDNSMSSIYNKNGFHYLAEEYAYIGHFLQNKERGWIETYYRRMYFQCMGRFRNMALSGSYWSEMETDMEIMKKMLKKGIEDYYLTKENIGKENWDLLCMYLQDSVKVYEFCKKELDERLAQLQDFLRKVNGKRIIIFGAGTRGRYIHALLERNYPGQAEAFCDNNYKLWNMKIQGLSVMSLRDAVERGREKLFVITNVADAENMKAQLMQMGVTEHNILLYDMGTEMRDLLAIK